MSLNWDEARKLVVQMRSEGATSEEIRMSLRDAGCSEIKISKLAPTQAQGSPVLPLLALSLGLLSPFFAALVFPVLARVTHRTPSSELLCRGLLMLAPLTVPITLGIIALATRSGRKYAAAVGIALPGVILVFMLSIILGDALRGPGPTIRCLSNIKNLALSQMIYASDWEEHFPPAQRWPECIFEYLNEEKVFLCPGDNRNAKHQFAGVETSYTMNALCGGLRLDSFEKPGDTVLLFDGTKLFGSHGAAAFRHHEGLNVALADGHARWCSRNDFLRLRLEP